MTAEFIRDAAATAAILGFFASSWFGWALDDPPPSWRSRLITGAILSVAIAAAGAFYTWRHWSDGSVFVASTSRAFGIVVGIEVALAGIGSWYLSAQSRSELIPAWIALVVGVHFFPLAVLLEYPMLHLLAVLVTVGALLAVPLSRRWSLPISAVTGAVTGSILLAAALFSLATIVV